MTLSFDPAEVATAADGWDDQHLALTGAGQALRHTSFAGFTAAAQDAAARFVSAWSALADTLAAASESQADAMRASAVRLIDADVHAGVLARILEAALQETR